MLDLAAAPLLVADVGPHVGVREGGAGRQQLGARLPDVEAAGLAGAVVAGELLAAVVVAHGVVLGGARRVGARAHAEPEVVPLLAAGPHAALAVHGEPLPAEAVAVEGGVEGLPAGHGGWEEGFGDGV